MEYFNPFGINQKQEVLRLICKLYTQVCKSSIFTLSTEDPSIDNFDRLSNFLEVFPAGGSYRDIILVLQNIGSDKLKRFDFGLEEENLLHYNQKTPPEVPLNKIRMPIALVSGASDLLST